MSLKIYRGEKTVICIRLTVRFSKYKLWSSNALALTKIVMSLGLLCKKKCAQSKQADTLFQRRWPFLYNDQQVDESPNPDNSQIDFILFEEVEVTGTSGPLTLWQLSPSWQENYCSHWVNRNTDTLHIISVYLYKKSQKYCCSCSRRDRTTNYCFYSSINC